MEDLTLQDLDNLWVEVEQAVDDTPGIDPWCSGPDWTVPVANAFAPKADRLLLATPDRTGFAFFTRYEETGDSPDGDNRAADGLDGGGTVRLVSGLEPLWGFGCPILDPSILNPGGRSIAAAAAQALAARPDWDVLYLPGMPPITEDNHPLHRAVTVAVARALTELGDVQVGLGITRQVADLTDGHDAWLARRSPRFRRNLRQAAAKAADAGLTMVDATEDPDLYKRLMLIEHRSWKGLEGSGITTPEMATMYRLMIERLHRRGRLHATVAQLDGADVGYIVGGIRRRRYRGLQISYGENVTHLSVGNLLQLHQLTELDRHDLADTYDLGMDIGYKQRWADRAESSHVLMIDRR